MTTIKEILETMKAPTLEIAIDGETLIDGVTVKTTLELYFDSWKYPSDKTDFIREFALFNNYYARGLKRSIDAMSLEYNPIENYDKNETNKTTNGERSGTDKFGESRSNSTLKTSGFNNGNLADDSSTIDVQSEHTNTTLQAQYVDTFESHVHGNIGVTRSQEMIRDEIELRRVSVAFDYIKKFVNKSCYYVGGVCNGD